MESIWLVLGLTAFSMVLGTVWYGPLFGKLFMWANEWPDFYSLTKEEQQKKQKEAWGYYGLQAVVTIIQMCVLGWFVETLGKANGIETALWLWVGFILPISAGNVIWNMKPFKNRLALLSIGLGYQLILILVAGFVFSM